MRTDELANAVWVSSSHSGAPGKRVEIAFLAEGRVALRDGKNPEGPVLQFTPGEWAAFVEGVVDGELRHP